jgi:hypothetical protein
VDQHQFAMAVAVFVLALFGRQGQRLHGRFTGGKAVACRV